jgi:hypothetical protein
MPTYADYGGWVISIIAGRFEVIADRDKSLKLWDAAIPVKTARHAKESGGDTARIGSSVSMAGFPAPQVE